MKVCIFTHRGTHIHAYTRTVIRSAYGYIQISIQLRYHLHFYFEKKGGKKKRHCILELACFGNQLKV